MNDVYFDDLAVGQFVRTSGRTVTEADIVLFAGLTGDHSPLHLDAIYAAENSPFGARIAHGALVSGMAVGLLAELRRFAKSGIAALGMQWAFTGAVLIGDTIRVEETITALRLTSDGKRGIVERSILVLNQRGQTVLEGKATTMVVRRAASEEGN